MLHRNKNRGEKRQERRKRWQDRRIGPDRRNSERLRRDNYDCRSGVPRRHSDIGGELADGEVWWQEAMN